MYTRTYQMLELGPEPKEAMQRTRRVKECITLARVWPQAQAYESPQEVIDTYIH